MDGPAHDSSSPLDYGPYEITSPADYWYRRHRQTGAVEFYDDATREWVPSSADRWPFTPAPPAMPCDCSAVVLDLGYCSGCGRQVTREVSR